MNVDLLTYDIVAEVARRSGAKIDERPHFHNFVGIRSAVTTVDNWDDYLIDIWVDENGGKGIKIHRNFTTDAGRYYMMKKLLNPAGCALLKRGFHEKLWRHGWHRGYKAFTQAFPATFYRDRNMDDVMDFDPKTIQRGVIGLNLHHGHNAAFVGGNSAGCQVLRYIKDLNDLLTITEYHAEHYTYFNYTLLEESDFQGWV